MSGNLIRENQNSIVPLRTRRTYVITIIYSTARNVRMYTHAHPRMTEVFNQWKCLHCTYIQRGNYLVTKPWNEFQRKHVRSLRVRQLLLPFETTDETTLQRTLQVHERKTQRSVTERADLVRLWHSSRLIWDTWVNSKSSMHITSW